MALLLGCGDNTRALLPDAAPPDAGPDASGTPCATASLGPAGGTIVHPDGARIVVPAGALGTDATISLCEDAAQPPGALGRSFVAGPPSVTFQKPVEVQAPFEPTAVAAGTSLRSIQVRAGTVPLQSTVDLAAGVVHGSTIRLGDFAPVQTSDPVFITTSAALPDGIVGTAYTVQLDASGGSPPYAWTATFGALPPGLALSTSGQLTGTPTAVGQFAFFVTVGDSAGNRVASGMALRVDPTTNPVPVLDFASPLSATVGSPATTLALVGKGFVPTSQVTWNGAALPTTFLDTTHLAASVPASDLAVAGTFALRVVNPPVGGGTSASLTFTVQPIAVNPAPVLAAVEPNALPIGSTDVQVQLDGSGFIASSSAMIGTQPITTSYIGPTQLAAIVPAAYLQTAGTLALSVVNPAPGGGTSASIAVTVAMFHPRPLVTGLVPSSRGPGLGDFTLHIDGSDFIAGAVAYFGATALATTVLDAGHIDALVPGALVASVGASDVVVVNPGPGGGASNAIAFTVTGACSWTTSAGGGTAADSRGVAIGDVDGDGDLDVVVTYGQGGSLQVLRNTGVPFTPLPLQPAGVEPLSVALADFDRDGHLDVVAGNYCSPPRQCTVTVLLGAGNGTFGPGIASPVGLGVNNGGEVVTADFDGDGYPDVAVANSASVSVLLGDGTGAFHAMPELAVRGAYLLRGIATGDFNGDGHADLVATDQGASGAGVLGAAAVFLGNGDGTFVRSALVLPGNGTFGVATADINGDGHLDFVVANNIDASITAYLGDGTGHFAAPVTTPVPNVSLGTLEDLVLADFDRDGMIDALTSNGPSGAVLLSGRGAGTFIATTTIPVGGPTIATADLDGDGSLDAAVPGGIVLGTCQ